MKPYIKINGKDNVVVALKDLKKEDVLDVENEETVLKQDIKRGHKIALKEFKEGKPIISMVSPLGML